MIDWMPTLCSIADCQMQDEYRWEGKNVWPLLAGQAPTPQPRTLYFKVDDDYAIRHGDWKLVKRDDASSELFNLKDDPFEQTNLADRESDRAAHLFELLEKHRAMDGPPLGWQEPARWRRARATTRGGLCLRSANAPC